MEPMAYCASWHYRRVSDIKSRRTRTSNRTLHKKSNGKIPVIAGTGSNSTEEAISLTKHKEKVGQI